jgi:DNA-binding NarL/FixJ family response regulator
MAVLNRSVQDVCGGKSSLLLIEGPAGIGKTRLLNEATRLASESRLTVLSARGSLLERSFGFGAARQLFEPLLLDAVRREALIAGSASSSRGVFEQIERDQRADGSFSVLHGLYWLTVNLTAEGPVVLAVDDVQWCDTGSLRFLAYLVKRLEGLPLLVVATLRTGEHHEDDELLAELALDPATISVRPGPLTDDATGLMVRDRLGEAAAPVFIAACHRTTGGNPLLLRQLLRALEVEGVKPDVAHTDTVRAVGSRAISSMVLMRLRRMPEVVTATARAVAVLGDSADLPQVAELAAVPEDDCAAALATLSRAEILRDEQRLAFVHPLVRDAVYRDVPAAERALAHERAARVLQSHGASPEQVAAHLLLAPRRGDAATVAVLRAAAGIAADRGASDTAVVLLRRALEEPALGRERVDVLLELGVLETLVDGPAAAEHLSEAYAFVDDPATRGETAIVIARTHVFASPPGVATAFARDAALALPADSVDVRQGLVALERITGFMHGLEPATYRRDPPPEITGNEPGALMLAATLGFETLLAGEDRERAVRLARFALADDRLWTVDTGLLWIVAAMTRMLADDDIGDFWDRARAHAHRTGAVFGALSANMWGGYAEWRRGELREALQSLADAAEQDRMWGGRVAPDYLDAITMGVYLDRGDLVAARRVADGALSREFVGEGRRLVLEMVARLLIEEKRPADALAALEDATDPVGIVNPAWAPWRGIRARALHELGRSAEARELIEEEVQLLRRWGAASSLGPSLRLLGEIAGAEGTPQLREAVQVLASTRASVELARARVSLAKAADVPDSEAVLLLEQAVESARSTCAEGVLQEALAALQRRGRQIDVRTETAAGLTRTERRVLDLTKAGLDEREIAQRLLLTPGRVRATLELVSSRSGV